MALTVAQLEARLTASTSDFDSRIAASERKLESFRVQARRTGSGAEDMGTSMHQTAEHADRLGSSLGQMVTLASSAFLAFGGYRILNFAKEAMIDFNSTLQQADMGFTKMLGSAQASKDFLEELERFAIKTPFEFSQLVDAAKHMMAFGFAADEVLPTLTAIGDAVSGMGGGPDLIDRITRAFGQMRAKGRVSAEEMLQLAEANVPAWKYLADTLGVTIPEAMKMAEHNAVDVEQAIHGIVGGMERDFGGMMAAQSRTWQGAMSNVHDAVESVLAKGFRPLFDTGTEGLLRLADLLGGPKMQDALHTMEALATRASNALKPLMDNLFDKLANWDPAKTAEGFVDLIAKLRDFQPAAFGVVGGLAAMARGMNPIPGLIGGLLLSSKDGRDAMKELGNEFMKIGGDLGPDLAKILNDLTPLLVTMLKAVADMVHEFAKLPEPVQSAIVMGLAFHKMGGDLLTRMPMLSRAVGNAGFAGGMTEAGAQTAGATTQLGLFQSEAAKSMSAMDRLRGGAQGAYVGLVAGTIIPAALSATGVTEGGPGAGTGGLIGGVAGGALGGALTGGNPMGMLAGAALGSTAGTLIGALFDDKGWEVAIRGSKYTAENVDALHAAMVKMGPEKLAGVFDAATRAAHAQKQIDINAGRQFLAGNQTYDPTGGTDPFAKGRESGEKYKESLADITRMTKELVRVDELSAIALISQSNARGASKDVIDAEVDGLARYVNKVADMGHSLVEVGKITFDFAHIQEGVNQELAAAPGLLTAAANGNKAAGKNVLDLATDVNTLELSLANSTGGMDASVEAGNKYRSMLEIAAHQSGISSEASKALSDTLIDQIGASGASTLSQLQNLAQLEAKYPELSGLVHNLESALLGLDRRVITEIEIIYGTNIADVIAQLRFAGVPEDLIGATLRGGAETVGATFGQSQHFFYQHGGRIGAGDPGIVGEVGPELFIPNRSGVIVPNDQISSYLNQATGMDKIGGNHHRRNKQWTYRDHGDHGGGGGHGGANGGNVTIQLVLDRQVISSVVRDDLIYTGFRNGSALGDFA